MRGKPDSCGVVEANRRQVLKDGVEYWRKIEENDTTTNLAKFIYNL